MSAPAVENSFIKAEPAEAATATMLPAVKGAEYATGKKKNRKQSVPPKCMVGAAIRDTCRGAARGARAARWGVRESGATSRHKSTRRHARAQEDTVAAGARTGAAGSTRWKGRGTSREKGVREGGARAETRRARESELRAHAKLRHAKARGKSGDAPGSGGARGKVRNVRCGG
jgi:hypothetical protein